MRDYREIPTSGRDVKWSFAMASLRPAELEGQKVLDVGAGYSQIVPTLIGMEIDAIAVDPRYADIKAFKKEVETEAKQIKMLGGGAVNLAAGNVDNFRGFQRAYHKNRDRFLPGDMAELDFEDNTFDVVIGTNSMTVYSDDLEKAIRESLRVTKPGGIVALSPWDTDPNLIWYTEENPTARFVRHDLSYTPDYLRIPKVREVLPHVEGILARTDLGAQLLEEGAIVRIEGMIDDPMASVVHLHKTA